MTTIGQQLVALANTIGVNSKKKIELKKELDIIEKDMNTNSVDDPSLAELLSNNKQLLEHVKEQKERKALREIILSKDKQVQEQ